MKNFIVELSEKLIKEFRNARLVDFYDVYQVLLAYWQETMSDDVFVLKYDGYAAGKEIVKIYKKEKDGAKKSDPKEIGWEGKLIPKAIVEKAFFASERTEIEKAEQVLAESESKIEEFVEENSGEDGVLSEFTKDDSEDLDTKKIGDELKKRKKAKDDSETFKVLNEWAERVATAKARAKIVKDLNKALDDKVKEKYAVLSEDDVKKLLVINKWSFDIFDGIESIYETTSHKIASRVTELAERYEKTLPEWEAEVSDYEKKVKAHLRKMGYEILEKIL